MATIKRITMAMTVAVLCLGGAVLAQASSIEFSYKSGITDTMLNRFAPTKNYDKFGYLGVYNYGGSNYQSLLRFDNMFGDGNNKIPLGSTISKATLRLYFYKGEGKNERQIYRMTSKWDGSSNWKSMGEGVTVGKQTEEKPDATYSDSSRAGFFGIDVTSSLQAWAKGASNLGWVIMGTGKNFNYSFYASSNNTMSDWRPTLSVTYTSPSAATPEPGTLLLMGSAAALLGWRRRRWPFLRRV